MKTYQAQYLDTYGNWTDILLASYDAESKEQAIKSILREDSWADDKRIVDAQGQVIAHSVGIESRFNLYADNLLDEIRDALTIDHERFYALCVKYAEDNK